MEEISDYQDAIDNGTYYTQVGINEKQAAVDTAQATLTEKQTQLSNAQSSSQAAKETYAADMANLKTQIEAERPTRILRRWQISWLRIIPPCRRQPTPCRRARQRRRAQTVHCS